MAMRHCQRALRLASSSWSSAHRGLSSSSSSSGWTDLGQSLTAGQSVAPATPQDFASRAFSSNYAGSPRAVSFPASSDVHDYNKLISTLNYKRRPNLARDVYEDMLLDGVQPVRDTFYLLISGCMRGSRLQDVIYFFEEMKAMGLTPDVALYNCVIAACGRSLQVDRAFQVAKEMEATGLQLKHRTLLTLLRTCAIAGRLDEAYGVVRRMAASGLAFDQQFYSALITAHKNHKPYSEDTVQKIFEILEQSKQHSAEDLMAVAAAGAFEAQDELDDGLLNFLSDDVQSRRGFINRRLTVYHAAVAALSSLGNKKAAKDVLNMVERDGQRIDSYCLLQLIKVNLAEGNFEEACAEYNKYVDAGSQPSLELYLMLIEGAIDNPSPAGSIIAQKLLAEIVQRGFFLNVQLGTLLLQRACKAQKRDVAVANMIWDMMRSRDVRISKSVAREYLWTLERDNTPNDDPRFLSLKAIVDEDGRSRANPKAGISPATSESGQVSEEHVEPHAKSGQVSEERVIAHAEAGQMSEEQLIAPAEAGQMSEEQVVAQAASADDHVEKESSIEAENSSETVVLTPAVVGDYSDQR